MKRIVLGLLASTAIALPAVLADAQRFPMPKPPVVVHPVPPIHPLPLPPPPPVLRLPPVITYSPPVIVVPPPPPHFGEIHAGHPPHRGECHQQEYRNTDGICVREIPR